MLRKLVRYPVSASMAVLVIYYSISILILPNMGYDATRDIYGHLIINLIYNDHPASDIVRSGDIILKIEDIDVSSPGFGLLFNNSKSEYKHEIQRDGQIIKVGIPNIGEFTLETLNRSIYALISTVSMIFSCIILMLVDISRRNDAWVFGIVTGLLAITFSSYGASSYNLPLSNVIFPLLAPFAAAGFIHLSIVFPKKSNYRVNRYFIVTIYTIAIISSLIATYLSYKSYSEMYINYLILLLGLSMMINIAILLFRFFITRNYSEKRDLLILLLVTFFGIFPLVAFGIAPSLIVGAPIMSPHVALALLVLLPVGYAYVIYRSSYFNIKIIITKTLALIVVGLAGVIGYALVYHAILQKSSIDAVNLWYGSAVVFATATLGIPLIGKPLGITLSSFFFREQTVVNQELQIFAEKLAAMPERSTLGDIIHTASNSLAVSRAELYTVDADGYLEVLASVRSSGPGAPILIREIQLPKSIVTPSTEHPLFTAFDWAEGIFPLIIGKRVTGILVLGQRVPDRIYTDAMSTYIQQLCNLFALAIEMIELYDASRKMRQQIIRIQDNERNRLSTQLHNEPLFQITKAMWSLSGIEEMVDNEKWAYSSLQTATMQLRNICYGLRPPDLGQGIHVAIFDIADRFDESSGMNTTLEVDVPETIILNHNINTAAYHILREALNNVEKHSGATEVDVQLTVRNGRFKLSVADNGVGTSLSKQERTAFIKAHHFGIASMFDWAEEIYGDLELKSRSEGGFEVLLTAPLEPNRTSIRKYNGN